MSRNRRRRVLAAAISTATIGVACLGEREPPAVEILEPRDGAALVGPNVRVTLGATGIEIAPASEERPGTAHHHLFIDRDPTPRADTIPSGRPGIIHLGRGQTDFMIMGMARGSHRVIAVLADRDHVPLEPSRTDTVRITIVGAR